MIKFLKSLRLSEEDGAVTVDWVVLTAAVTGLGISALFLATESTNEATTKISDAMLATTFASD